MIKFLFPISLYLCGGLRVVDEDAVVSAVEHAAPCVVNVNTLKPIAVETVMEMP